MSSAKRRKKKAHQEEHMDETWLIPYSDMLTLLLALFIVMFASSQMDKDKFDRMKEQFNTIFSGTGSSGVLFGNNQDIDTIPTPFDKPTGNTASEIEKNKMKKIKEHLKEQVDMSNLSDKIKIKLYTSGLEISIQNALLFNSGKTVVRSDVTPILAEIAKMLQKVDNDVKVIGHTDNVPINTSNIKSNWELSVMRAINVMNYLRDNASLKPKRFIIQGHGEYSPKFDNSTEEGRAKNRRVEIFIVRKYPSPINENASDQTESITQYQNKR